MSYTIDIYRKELKPTNKFFDFALFVSFFPQLVAGPIERAKNLLPQVLAPRKITLQKFYEGCYLILWGIFLKVFVADNLARIADPIFSSNGPYSGAKVLIAVYAFTFQIFGDFAGYSSIARGLGSCMGFKIMINFKTPYLSKNIREFWQRWHISLSSWLKDYLYIPLGGNRKGKIFLYFSLAVTMLLCGLWHGAAWTFIVFGAYHGFLLIVHRLLTPSLSKINLFNNFIFKKISFTVRVIFCFHLVCIGFLIFRSQSLSQAWSMFNSLFYNFKFVSEGDIFISPLYAVKTLITFIWLLAVKQIIQYRNEDVMAVFKLNFILKAIFYFLCFYSIIIYGVEDGKEFIYFQF